MPFIPHNSPEARLPRSDSKNPATTCKGITTNGRPCRRSLGASPRASPSPSGSPNPKAQQGVLAVLPDVNDAHEGAAAFYCWQHKDQAAHLKRGNEKANLVPLKERSSIDTLAERLGILDVDDGQHKRKKKDRHNIKPVKRDTLPQQWQNVPGPLISVPEDPFGPRPAPARPVKPHGKRTQGDLHFSFFCCMKASDTDASPPARPRPSMTQAPQASPSPSTSRPPAHVSPRPSQSAQGPFLSHESPKLEHTYSETQDLLSMIPANLPPAKTSTMLFELSKPFTNADREPGFIYIFCLAPTAVPQVDASRGLHPRLASSNLPQESKSRNKLEVPTRSLTGRRTSDAIRSFASESNYEPSEMTRSPAPRPTTKSPPKPPATTLMLKIGRAQNVSRRMTQWSQQCGHPIDLLRYYPYQPQLEPRPQQTPPVRKVPLCARVERMIHLELAEKRVKRNCEGCGREHREWFEVEGTKEGVRGVDVVVKRWVRWAHLKIDDEESMHGESMRRMGRQDHSPQRQAL